MAMEELLVFALLLHEDIAAEDAYNDRLNELFLDNPEDEHLLSLVWETDITRAIIYIKTHIDYNRFDYERFGRILMDKLMAYYNSCHDIKHFAGRMYHLWENLPGVLQDREPFLALNYADDCLSWGDEGQTRSIYERMLNYYKDSNDMLLYFLRG